jgi:hypothetical protein
VYKNVKNMQEIWKEIKNYPNYKVSNLGRVKRITGNGGILKPQITGGYYHVSLCADRKISTKRVHQIVAIAFLDHTPSGHVLVVDHIDFDTLNNNVNNLRIITQRENTNRKHLNSSSKYVGVHWNKKVKKWRARITISGRLVHLGYFLNEIDASNAYDKALKECDKK